MRIFRFIVAKKAEHSIQIMCRVLDNSGTCRLTMSDCAKTSSNKRKRAPTASSSASFRRSTSK